jgi:hypothetical protein
MTIRLSVQNEKHIAMIGDWLINSNDDLDELLFSRDLIRQIK